jgi:two-component system, sensor histidine kinase and response regulator
MARILVIEDIPTIRENIAEILALDGYDVLNAENGALGIQLAQDALPDLIICDIMMPQRNGYEVVQELQRNPATAVIPFLFLTSKNTYDSVRQAMDLGADDYLTKPFVAEELLSAVHTRLEKRAHISQQFEQQFDELRGNLISLLPHELRTPLSTIMGYAELILMDKEMGRKETEHMVKTIARSGKRLQRVIENYLLYARTEIQRHDSQAMDALSKQQFETPGLLIRDVAQRTAAMFERQNDLSVHTENAPVQISGEMLKKMIEELADNAFKFSNPGTRIDIQAEKRGNHYRFQISDQGRGMTPEEISRIGAYMQFERKLYEQQGMGLGLILAKRLTELHGGELSITSEPKQGTTIDVTLQLVQ